ncbi:MAG TPA: GNAT family N-acetyltransferase [Solirubrobacteraceae bacterium]|jgi:aminoglycoside 2'-N-acetyltransferase I
MDEVIVGHTADLDPEELAEAHRLLEDVFGEELKDTDWSHALGGMHALVWERAELVGHASVVTRRLMHRGRVYRTGYVEAVAVDPAYQGRGFAAAMMDELERIVRGAYELGALGATEMAMGFYAARGWQLWRGPTSAISPDGVMPTPWEDGSIYVFPVTSALDLDGELTCDWREGDVW